MSDLILGGRFETWPLIDAAGVGSTAIRVDPAAGLFGLSIAERDGFLADPANRQALSAAFDRASILAPSHPIGTPPTGCCPMRSIRMRRRKFRLGPAHPGRAAGGSRRRASRPGASRCDCGSRFLRGPARTCFNGQIGANPAIHRITPERVAEDAPADLRLIDAVAPFDSARWYLATACAPCGPAAQAAIEQARLAPTLAARSARSRRRTRRSMPIRPSSRWLGAALVARQRAAAQYQPTSAPGIH